MTTITGHDAPEGTVVRVTPNSSSASFTCVDAAGNIITGIPAVAVEAACDREMALRKEARASGPAVWKLISLDEFYAEETAMKTRVVQDKSFHITNEVPTEHAVLKQWLRHSYQLKPPMLKIDELRWRFAIRAVVRGENLLIRGDSGCGKTSLVLAMVDVFKRPFFPFNFGATQDARSFLIGNTHFKKNEGTYIVESEFVRAIQTPNAIILLDELSRANNDAHNILLTVVDPIQRYLRIDERPDTPLIKVAEGVTFIATANVGTEYTATRTMDRALLDRFTTILMEPLTIDQEIELLSERHPDLDSRDVRAIAEIACDTREDVRSESPRFTTSLSTRITTEMADLMYDGFSLEEAATVKIYPFYTEASELTFISQIVQQHVRTPDAVTKNDPFGGKDPNGNLASPVNTGKTKFKVIPYPKSTGKGSWEVVIWSDKTTSCNCPGWTQNSKRSCKHVNDQGVQHIISQMP